MLATVMAGSGNVAFRAGNACASALRSPGKGAPSPTVVQK
jgi:hypothetical protein